MESSAPIGWSAETLVISHNAALRAARLSSQLVSKLSSFRTLKLRSGDVGSWKFMAAAGSHNVPHFRGTVNASPRQPGSPAPAWSCRLLVTLNASSDGKKATVSNFLWSPEGSVDPRHSSSCDVCNRYTKLTLLPVVPSSLTLSQSPLHSPTCTTIHHVSFLSHC